MDLAQKQRQFNSAMELYNTLPLYKQIGMFIAVTNISLQLYLVWLVLPYSVGVAWQLFSIVTAYILTDFINGLVHMYMDNNDRYHTIVGPLIANFHLHHKVPQYKKNNLLIVYFVETGSKVWLVAYLLLVRLTLGVFDITPVVSFTLVYIGILSSVAEVSHYLCHSSTSLLSRLLGNCGLLLSKRHHARHHLEDNRNYAFLNGITDPLLNLIAARWSNGYKFATDLHYENYDAGNAENR